METSLQKTDHAKSLQNAIRRGLIVFAILLFNMLGFAQLNVTTGFSPDQYIDKLIGGGITYSNVVYNGHPRAIGMFSTGTIPTNLGMSSGFMLATGYVNGTPAIGSNASNFLSNQIGTGSDADLYNIVKAPVYNAASIEFDFVPVSDTIRFRYVFASEEYPEYVCTKYNDVFAFLLSGPNPLGGNYNKENIALIPGTTLPVAINTVNPGVPGYYNDGACSQPGTSLSYSHLYVDNSHGVNIVFDGFTVVLTAWAVVVPCEEYHIKLAIGDVSDQQWDSGVFFEENSFYSPSLTVPVEYLGSAVIGNYAVEASCPDKGVTVCFTLDKPAPYNTTVNYSLSGTAIEGVDYPNFPDPIVIPMGEESFCYTFTPFEDGLVEETETIIIISNVNASCKADTTVIPILDHQPLDAIISDDMILCTNTGSAEISVTPQNGIPPYQYSWSHGLPSQASHTVQPSQTTTYTVTITDACDQQVTKSVTIIVDSASVDLGPDIGLCYGQSIQINAITAQTNILWSNGETSSSIIVAPSSTTTYSATVTSEHNCVATDEVVVNIFPLPTVDAGNDQSICVGESAQLNGSGALIYHWEPSGTLNNPNIANPIATPTTTTTYYLTGLAPGGNIINNGDFSQGNTGFFTDYTYSSNLYPEGNYYITNNPRNHHPDFSACYDHTPNPENQMMVVNGAPIANQKIWCQNIAVNPNTDYAFGTWITSVHPNNPAVLQFSINSVLLGSPFTATSTTCNWQQFYEVWNSGANTNAEICIVNQNTIKLGNDFAIDDISFAPLCENIDSVVVTVKPIPEITINPDTICAGETATLTATSNIPGTTFVWSNGATGATITVSPTTTTSYSVTGTANNCSASASASVVVNPNPIINITATDGQICVGEPTTITASSNIQNTSFAWNTGESAASITVSPNATTNYTVTGTTPAGCSNSANISITVNPIPEVNVNATDNEICDEETVTITATSNINGSTFAWSSGQSTPSITVSPNTTTDYTVTVTSPEGCVGTASTNIIVHPNPVITVSATDAEICAEEPTTITATSNIPNTSFAWNTGESTASITVNPNTTTNYTVTGTTEKGCSSSANISITVHPIPVVNINVTDNEICDGETVTITAQSNINGSTFAWNTGQNTASITVSPNTTTNYTVTVTSPEGCVGTASTTIIVNPNPIVTVSATDNEICVGETVTITAQSNINGSTFAWSSGQSTPSITVSPNTTTNYTVTVTSPEGCVGTASTNIIVNPNPVITVTATDGEICVGESVTITAQSNINGSTFAWSSGQTTNQIIVSPTVTSTYYLIVTSPEGCVKEENITIIVNPNPTPTIVSSSSAICLGFAAQLTCNTDIAVSSYLWNTNETSPSISVSPSNTSTYSVTVTTEKGCVGTAEIPITVNFPPAVNINAPSNKICIGSEITLTGESNNSSVTYIWSTGENANSITVSPLQTTSYTVIGTDANGCKDTTSLTITVNPLPVITLTATNTEVCEGSATEIFANSSIPNTTYLWNTGETTSILTVTPTTTTTYSVIGTDTNGCVGNSEILISVLPRPDIAISSPSETICKGDTTSLTANSVQAVSFAWSNGENIATITVSPNFTTTYSVVVTDSHGCTNTANSTVTVRELPVLTINNSDPNVCEGSAITLVVSGAVLYDWSPSDGLNTNVGATVIASPSATTNYIVSGVDLYGCSSSTNVVVTVNPLPNVDFTADERDICMETIVHFKGSSDADIKEWAWNFGDVTSGASNTSSIQNPTHTFFETGSYTISLTATTTKGCKNTIRKPNYIIVHPNPIASFVRTPDITTLENPVIHFYNQSLGETKYLWDFDDPGSGLYNNSIEENPTHKYSVEGEYWITLLVENEWGCIDTVKNRVIVNPDWAKFVPSAFTPNGDGKNDYFRPVGFNIDYSEYSMYIYDRWGKELFATHDIEDAWDGRVNRTGEIVPQDVYVYIIILKDVNGIEHQFVGHVTVVK